MQVPYAKAAAQFSNELPAVIAIAGNEALLVEELLDSLRKSLPTHGVDERIPFAVEGRFDWDGFVQEGNAMSLFGTRRCFELRIPSGKPGDKGSKAINTYCQRKEPTGDLLVLILPKLDKRQLQSKWVKAIDALGWVVQCPEVGLDAFPAWLKQRFASRGLRLQSGAIELLVTCLEGNLLAAGQEVDKLHALSKDGGVTIEMIRSSLSDQARYTVFELVDMSCSGELVRSLRILKGLQREGVEPTIVVWSIAREIRTMASVAGQIASGTAPSNAYRENGVWSSREAIVSSAIKRIGADGCYNLLRRVGELDQLVKGQRQGDVWLELEKLIVMLNGVVIEQTPNELLV